MKTKDILIQAMRTPNPLALKFATNFPFKIKGSATFTKNDSAEPFFEPFFSLSDLSQVYVFENQMTLTFDKDFSFEDIEKEVGKLIRKNFSVHNPDFEMPDEKHTPDRSKLSPALRKIEEILDRTVRPGLQADGGDLEVISFKDNKLEISYQGACGGCPSSYMGTLQAIENILRHEMENEEIFVYPV